MKEVNEMPSWYFTIPSWIPTGISRIGFPKKLHSHHSKYEYDDAKDEGQVGQRAHRIGHDCQDVIEGLPRFGQFEDAQ